MGLYVLRAFLILVFGACADGQNQRKNMSQFPEQRGSIKSSESEEVTDHNVAKDPLAGFSVGAVQLRKICERKGHDKVRQVFCSSTPPKIENLSALQQALGLSVPDSIDRPPVPVPPLESQASFAILGHSTSLVGRHISAANPRVILFTPLNVSPPVPVPSTSGQSTQAQVDASLAFAFARGEQLVEIIANDPVSKNRAFYLGVFTQACNRKKTGCSYTDLLGPDIERAWESFTLYEDVDLKNTILDCQQCHQPDGPQGRKIFIMKELRFPWTHFFDANTDGGNALLLDYKEVHGGKETYGGIPGSRIPQSNPQALENFIVANGDHLRQPGLFDAPTIEREVQASNPGQPTNNHLPGKSPTWQMLYERSVIGEIAQVPYHDVKVTEADKLQKKAAEYQDFLNGKSSTISDIREVLKTTALRQMGFMVKANLDGEGILRQACQQCHHDKLDQTISRALFNVNLSKMSRGQKDEAIKRLNLPETNPLAMPPSRFKTLTKSEKELLIKLLRE